MLDHPLYRAILDDHDNDSLRLVFADWLEEQGDPRGDFIRTQIRLTDSDLDKEDRHRLEALERDLLKLHRRRWNAPLHRYLSATTSLQTRKRGRGDIRGWGYTRGFVSHLTIDAGAFARAHEQLKRIFPIDHVCFSRILSFPEALFQSPALRGLRSIDCRWLPYAEGRTNTLVDLAASMHASDLRSIRISGTVIRPTEARALADSTRLPKLQTLDLRQCHVTPPAAEILWAAFGSRLKASSRTRPSLQKFRRKMSSYRSPPVRASTIARWASRLLNG